MYDYPLDFEWSTDEIIDVIALYNAVEKAYEEGIESSEFMDAYRKYTAIVDTKMEQKKIEKEFAKLSGYSIYAVFKRAQEGGFIHL